MTGVWKSEAIKAVIEFLMRTIAGGIDGVLVCMYVCVSSAYYPVRRIIVKFVAQ